MPPLEAWGTRGEFAALIPISATAGVGVVDVVRELLKVLPEGPPLFDPDTLTDRSERFLAAELIREQLFLRLRQEIPYATAVQVDNWEERSRPATSSSMPPSWSSTTPRRPSWSARAGRWCATSAPPRAARSRRLLGRPVHLRLFVKVAPRTGPAREHGIARLGYRKGE